MGSTRHHVRGLSRDTLKRKNHARRICTEIAGERCGRDGPAVGGHGAGSHDDGHVPTPNPPVADLAAKRAEIATKKSQTAAAESALAMKEGELETLSEELGELLTRSARNSQDAVDADRTKMTELKIPVRAIA